MATPIKTNAIVIKTINYSDKHLIVHLFTESLGRLSFFVYGGQSRKKKSFFLPLNSIEIIFTPNNNRDLQIIKEIGASNTFSFHNQYNKIPAIFLISELLDKTIPYEIEDNRLFRFLTDTIMFLDRIKNTSAFFSQFLIFYSFLLGILSNEREKEEFDIEYILSQEQAKYISNLLLQYSYNEGLKLPPVVRHDLIEKLLKNIQEKMNISPLKSYEVFKRMY